MRKHAKHTNKEEKNPKFLWKMYTVRPFSVNGMISYNESKDQLTSLTNTSIYSKRWLEYKMV